MSTRTVLSNHLLSRQLRLFLLGLPLLAIWSIKSVATDSKFAEYFENLKRNPEELKDFLKRMPKGGELHSHLSGAVPFDKLFDVAVGHGYSVAFRSDSGYVCGFTLPGRKNDWKEPCSGTLLDTKPAKDLSPDERERLHRAVTVAISDAERGEKSGFGRFNRVFERLNALTDNADVMPELVQEVMQQAAENNVSYLELRVNPIGRKNSDGISITLEDLIKRLQTSIATKNQQLGKDHEIAVKFIIGLQRQSPNQPGGITNLPSVSCSVEAKCAPRLRQAYFLAARRYAGLVVGVDLVGLPEVDSTADFSELRKEFGDTSLTLHAGETLESKWNSHVEKALLDGAKRIGHGFNLDKDPATEQLLCDRQIPIEVSLTSNLLLGLVLKDDLKAHPFPKYFRAEICSNDIRNQYGHLPVTLNTDDAGIFETSMTDQFFLAITTFDLKWNEVEQLCRNSLIYSFANDSERLGLLRKWEREIAQLENALVNHGDAERSLDVGQSLKKLFFWIFGSTVIQSFLGPFLLYMIGGFLYWLFVVRRRRFVVVSEFRVWGDLGKEFPEKGVAERLRDELKQLFDKMAQPIVGDAQTEAHSGTFLGKPEFFETSDVTFPETQVTLQYKGISLEALKTSVRRISRRELTITGDLMSYKDGLRVVARARDAGLGDIVLDKRDSATLQVGLWRLALKLLLTTMTNKSGRKAADVLVHLQAKAREVHDYEQAFNLAQLGKENAPNTDRASWNLALAYSDLGRQLVEDGHYKEAVHHFEEATREYPNFDKAYDVLGKLYDETNDHQKAIAARGKAEEIRSRRRQS